MLELFPALPLNGLIVFTVDIGSNFEASWFLTRARSRPAARAGRGFAASQPHNNPRARERD